MLCIVDIEEMCSRRFGIRIRVRVRIREPRLDEIPYCAIPCVFIGVFFIEDEICDDTCLETEGDLKEGEGGNELFVGFSGG
jgi:hypothetical protein